MRTVEQFLGELEEERQYLNGKDRLEVVKHYRDKINIAMDYGDSAQKVLATLPTPQKIAEEVYASKGINYLEKRKKAKRRNQIFFAILNSIIILILLGGFITIGYFDIYYVIRLFVLIVKSFSFFNFIDTSLLILFNLSYIGILLIGLIYVFDLFYIMIMHLLETVLDAIFKEIKEYPFMDFTLSGTIEHLLKKKRLVLKVLIGCGIAFVVFGISGYATKGYIYRSMNNTIETRQTITIDEDINTVKIPENSMFIKITTSKDIDKVTFKYGSEFEDDFKYNIVDGSLTITPNKTQKFDILGFLSEPRQILEIILPVNTNVENINLTYSDGVLDIANVNEPNLNINISGINITAAFTNTTLNSLVANGTQMNLALENNKINTVDVIMKSGKYCGVSDNYQNIKIVNNLGTIILQKATFSVANIENTSGKAAIDRIDATTFNYQAIRSEDYFLDTYVNDFNLSVLYNSNVQINRVVVKNEFKIEEDGAYLKIDYAKCKTIIITGSSTTNNLYHLGEDVSLSGIETDSEDYESYTKYNDSAYNKLAIVKAETKDGRISMLSGSVYSIDFKLNKTSLEMATISLNDAYVSTSDSKINLTDISGKTFDLKTKGGSVVFYNDSEVSKASGLVLTFDGSQTMQDIDENIKRG